MPDTLIWACHTCFSDQCFNCMYVFIRTLTAEPPANDRNHTERRQYKNTVTRKRWRIWERIYVFLLQLISPSASLTAPELWPLCMTPVLLSNISVKSPGCSNLFRVLIVYPIYFFFSHFFPIHSQLKSKVNMSRYHHAGDKGGGV
jgi:hypothetical protein